MKIESTKNAATDQGIKLLVYGLAGVGKTRLCATTGDLEHTLILSAEAGLLSLRGFDIDSVRIDSLDTLREVYTALRKGEIEKKYRWVCLDSISEIAEVCLEEEGKKSITSSGKEDMRAAYGNMGRTMGKLIRLFRDLPGVNVYMSAKMERVETDTGIIWAPSLPGRQLSQGIAYWFDEVFALRARDNDGETIRKLQTRPDGHYDCKDRSGTLESYEAADLHHIETKIHNTGE